MICIDLPEEPFWLKLSCGIELRCLPLDTALLASARARAARRLRELLEHVRDVQEAGGKVVGLPDLDDPDRFVGQMRFLEAQAVAEMGVVDWQGVGDAKGAVLPFDKTLLPKLMRHGRVAEEFVDKYTAPYTRLEQEKNASAPAPDGTSAAGTPTASDAEQQTPPAPEASEEKTDTSAPTTSTSPAPERASTSGT